MKMLCRIGRKAPLKLTRMFSRLSNISTTNKTIIFAVIIAGALALKSRKFTPQTNEEIQAFKERFYDIKLSFLP